MSDDGWRTTVRWVVAHPTEAKVLLARREGALRLPGTEHPGRVWTAKPGQVLPGLRDLLGADALLLRSLDEHEDLAARAQRAPARNIRKLREFPRGAKRRFSRAAAFASTPCWTRWPAPSWTTCRSGSWCWTA